jgi:hypothetical protein
MVERYKYHVFADVIEASYKEGLDAGAKIERERIIKEVSKNDSFIWDSGTTQETLISFIESENK